MGIRIIDNKEDKALNIWRALIRSLSSYLSIFLLGIGFIAIAFNKDKIALHDYLAGSRVIEIKRPKIIQGFTAFFAFLSIIIGLIVSVFFLMAMIFTLNYSFTSLKESRVIEAFNTNSFIEGSPSKIISLNNGKIAALTEFKKFAEHIEYTIDSNDEKSIIAEAKLRQLGATNLDFNYGINLISKAPIQFKLEKSIVIPKLIIKVNNGNELEIINHKFIVGDENIIADDLLSLFNYRNTNNEIEISIFADELRIIQDPALDQKSKDFLLSLTKKIRNEWRDALIFAPVTITEDLNTIPEAAAITNGNTAIKTNKALENKAQISINTKTGDTEKVTLINPSKSESFNKFTEDFLSKRDRLRFIPEELKTQEYINLELTLTYSEKV